VSRAIVQALEVGSKALSKGRKAVDRRQNIVPGDVDPTYFQE